jgi:glycerol-3-phosphate acyltransferase PlsY
MNAVVLLVCGYLVGSLSFAVIVSRLFGLPDPHDYGSGNPGATNVLRTGNKTAALLTLVGDALKGLVVVLVARALATRFGFTESHIAGAGLTAFLGHLYPVFFRFKGGKGVATAAGVLFGFSGWLGLAVTAVWVLAFLATRISSVGALTAAAVTPVLSALVCGWGPFAWCSTAMAILLVWRHRENIRKLRAGTEARVKSKA